MKRSSQLIPLLVLFAGCKTRTYNDETSGSGVASTASQVECTGFSSSHDNGLFLRFGIFDECLGKAQQVQMNLFAKAFPAASAAAVCVAKKSTDKVDLAGYEFASANDYENAVRSEAVTDPAAFGRLADRYKRRFRWVHLNFAAPVECQNGTTVREGWLNTKEVMEIIDRHESVPSGEWNGKFVWPSEDLPLGFLRSQIVSPFGSSGEERRTAGAIGQYGPDGLARKHGGIDIALVIGTPERATAPGVVVEKGYNHRSGWYLNIRHDSKTFSHYGHNETIEVKVGDQVAVGQQVSHVGFGGSATLPHIHYGINISNSYVDPIPFLPSTPELAVAAPLNPKLAPRNVHLWLGNSPVDRTVSATSLRAWISNGEIAPDLKNVLTFLPQDKQTDFKGVLSKRLVFPFNTAQLDEFVRNSPVGSKLISELSEVFKTSASTPDPSPAVRGTLILLSASGKSFSVLDFLENYPLADLNVNILGVSKTVEGSKDIVAQLKELNQVHPL